MTPLERLAAQKRTPGQMWATAEDIAVDEALIAVAQAADRQYHGFCGPKECAICIARKILDNAIIKAMETK